MKELHSWARWFRALSRKIAGGGEEYLIRKAKAVKWAGKPALLKGEDRWIDPFSFLYTLAYQAGMKAFPAVYQSAHDVFALDGESDLPDTTNDDLWVFPMPVPLAALFHSKTTKHFSLLWRLFRQATGDEDSISASDYKETLAISGVAPKKLSHGLFLSNPYRFLPVDGFALLAGAPTHVPALANDHPYKDYTAACDRVRQFFPECEPFEINYFLYWQGDDGGWVNAKSSVFHVDTNQHGDGNDVDFWPEFEENNSVRTSGQVAKPKVGDIVLVRYGETQGRAIGVVMKNDSAKGNNLGEQGRVHVSWINKASSPLVASTESLAFGVAGCNSATYQAFAGTTAYRPTRDLLKGVIPVNPQTHPLNQILYGPPGTGKTWNTVALAVAIVEGKDVESVEKERKEQPDEVKRRFDLARESGQVAMVTFHQNYAYEDFIEGIRPVVEDDADGGMAFEMRHGVFRNIADKAARNLRESSPDDQSFDVDELIQSFLEFVEMGLDSDVEFPLEVPDADTPIRLTGVRRRKSGDINGFFLDYGGRDKGRALLVLRRDYGEFHSGRIASFRDIKPINKAAKGPWHSFARDHYGMMKRLKQYQDQEWEREPAPPVERRNFVLILDEINRGNIARIFGELITLVEESRRIGRGDETKVTLPSSGEEFGVPENLYLIGTMNTADRSIALLDTALRRRFEFVEMMPISDHPKMGTDIEGVNLRLLLKTMNERIRFLRDREHQIGHTYFLEVGDLKGLKKVFQNRILPLLQEYFYDDWAKIAAVLGDNGFVESVERPPGLDGGDLVDADAKSYELLPFDDKKWEESAPYQKIYEQRAAGGAGGK